MGGAGTGFEVSFRGRRRRRRRWSARSLVVLIDGVFGGMGGLYLMTGSVLVTVVAGVVAVIVVALVLR